MLWASRRASPSSPAGSQRPCPRASKKPGSVPSPAADRVGAGHEQPAVVVRAARPAPCARAWRQRLEALALGHLLEPPRRELRHDVAQQAVGAHRARAVQGLQHVEQQQHSSTMSGGEAAGHVEQRVRQKVRHAGLAQARHKVVDGLARRDRPGRTWPHRCSRPPRAHGSRSSGNQVSNSALRNVPAGGRWPESRPACCGR